MSAVLPSEPGAILRQVQTIAIVGASSNAVRASNYVMAFLQQRGYRTIPVNPMEDGKLLHGERVYARLADIPAPVDMVDIFRHSDAAGEAVDEAIAEKERLGIRAIWMQLGVINEPAARRAQAAGLAVVMDKCPKIEYPRLFGDRSRAEIGQQDPA